MTIPPRPTIDQVMAWSPNFYKNLDGVRVRALVGPADQESAAVNGNSWGYSNPAARSGTIQRSTTNRDPRALFTTLFMGQTTAPADPATRRKPIVDRVLADYQRLRQSNRRMSAEDRQRLDDHMARMAELQRSLTALGNPIASCKDVKAPNVPKPAYNVITPEQAHAFNDVFVAAFLCGASRIAVTGINEGAFVTYPGSWHQDTAHKWDKDPAAQQRLVAADRAVFNEVFLDLITKMDAAVEAPGQTLLDNGLVQMVSECGEATHSSNSIPIITAGSAGGFLRTGLLCDYRNQNRTAKAKFRGQFGAIAGFAGLSYNRWLGTVLQAMGLPRSEFERPGDPGGYGDPRLAMEYVNGYLPAVMAMNGEVAPFLKA